MGAGADVTIVDSVITNNASVGLGVSGSKYSATASLAGSVVTKNGIGVNIDTRFGGATVFSYGDNEIDGIKGTLTPLAKR